MPFDGNPIDYETKPDVFSLEGLIAWLETQEPETQYDYCDPRGCLLCSYFRARGIDVNTLTILGIRTFGGDTLRYPEILADAAGNGVSIDQHTYGHALARAKALLNNQ